MSADHQDIDDIMAEEEFLDDSWAGEDTELVAEKNPSASGAARPRKKRGLFNLAVIGIAVIAGVFMLYRNFVASAVSVAPAPEAETAASDLPAPVAIENAPPQAGLAASTAPTLAEDVPPPPPPVEGGAALENLSENPVDQPLTPMPDTASNPEPQPGQTAVTELPAATETPPQEQPTDALPQVPSQISAQNESAPAPAADIAVAPVAETGAAMQAALAALKGELETRIAANESSLARMQESLGRIEVLLAESRKEPASVAEEALPEETPRRAEPEPETASQAEAQAVPETPATSESATARTSKAVATAKSAWTLRSAREGTAVLAAANGEMRTVAPGDRVPGLGTIRSIGQANGRWIVRGTQGSVTR